MVVRFVALAALAVLSSACAYRIPTTARDVPLDHSDSARYAEPFAQSPSRPFPADGIVDSAPQEGAPSPAPRGSALGFSTGAAADTDTVTAEASSTEYEEVEATPGTACYDAALKAGITRGTCTLVVERKYVLVGEKAERPAR